MTGVASKNTAFASGPGLLPLAISAPLRRPGAAPLVLTTGPALLHQSTARTAGTWVNAFLASRGPRGEAPAPLQMPIAVGQEQLHVSALSLAPFEPRADASPGSRGEGFRSAIVCTSLPLELEEAVLC
jgi:hypothetical protein